MSSAINEQGYKTFYKSAKHIILLVYNILRGRKKISIEAKLRENNYKKTNFTMDKVRNQYAN